MYCFYHLISPCYWCKRAVQIYGFKKSGRYELDLDAIKTIFGRPDIAQLLIAVYCIAGKLRSGKSFILGLLLKFLMYGEESENWIDVEIENNFNYSNSGNRVTIGIWIWSEPIIRKNVKGEDVAVFLMDTQGWHDDQTSLKDSSLIFGMSALLSSVVMFNVDKNVGEDDLYFLQSFSSTAKYVGHENDEPFQNLMFLIRNWQMTHEETGFQLGFHGNVNPFTQSHRDFIQNMFDPTGKSEEARQYRELVCRFYERIIAFLLPYPGNVINYDRFDSSRMDGEFRNHLKNLCEFLFDKNRITVKSFNGRNLRCIDLIRYSREWAEDFQDGPKMSLVPVKDESMYLVAYQTALDTFDETLKNKIGLYELDALKVLLQQLRFVIPLKNCLLILIY